MITKISPTLLHENPRREYYEMGILSEIASTYRFTAQVGPSQPALDSTFYNVVHVILRFSNGQVGRLQASLLPFVDPQYSMTITHGKKWVAWQDVWLVVALIVLWPSRVTI